MKKTGYILVIAALFLFCTVPVFSQAVIREITGTVEIMLPGSAEWVSARQGQSIPADTVISTGMRSFAIIAIGDAVLTVRPITRLSLAELSRIEGIETIQLNMQTGRVRAEVKAPVGNRTDLIIQTPSAVASVRGTIFEFDTVNITVIEGTVAFSGIANVPVLIDAGVSSHADERTGRAALPEETSVTELRPDLPYASDFTAPPDRLSSENAVDLQAVIWL